MTQNKVILVDEAATETFGQQLAEITQGRGIISLSGDLGTGKTTLSRGLIRAFGHKGAVKSPTYTLVEPYEFKHMRVMHFDLYRLEDPEELEFLGFRDYLDDNTLCLIEWPEKALDYLPTIDLQLSLAYAENNGRTMSWLANSDYGHTLSQALNKVQRP
jgi:tRNA threonylcarbamoyladenosine biosynthesis protein TsaE